MTTKSDPGTVSHGEAEGYVRAVAAADYYRRAVEGGVSVVTGLYTYIQQNRERDAKLDRCAAELGGLEAVATDIMRNINERDECPFCDLDGYGEEGSHDRESLCGRLEEALAADDAEASR